ncbi:MAG: FG-GAP-like repeat-containing protein [Pseudomonadota bacterium]
MKRKTISGVGPFFGILLALCLSLALPFHSWGAAKTRVAVIDFEQKGEQEFRGKQVGEIVAEWLITSLVRTGRFDVVERAQLQKIFKEQQLGMTGVINQETAAKVGELLGVKLIITGSVIRVGNAYDINTRLINVEDGSILKAEKIRGPVLDVIERMMDSLADTIKKDFPILGYVVMVTGKRAMLDVGKIHGVEPGMRFMAFRQGAPVRHPVTGKMLKGEDIRIGEIAVQNVQIDTSWSEIIQEEPGAKIAAGNLTRSTGLEGVAPASPVSAQPTPSKPAPIAMKMWAGMGRAEKVVADWNGDGLYDLILGDRDGFVTVYLNQGTNAAPRYAVGMKLRGGGKEIKVKNPSAPYLVDWNGDGKIDLLVGDGGGYLHLFLNAGAADSVDFAPGVKVQAAGKDLDEGSDASPCVVDWNEDGKKDLAMGMGNGVIYILLNEGSNEQPIFGKPIELNGGSLDVGSNSSPDFADWNGDGKKDLIIGNDDGEIFVFLNKGTNEDPQYENKGEKLPLKFGDNASPRVIGWNRPGANDLVIADRNGEVSLCVNTGTPQSPAFSEKKVLRTGKR